MDCFSGRHGKQDPLLLSAMRPEEEESQRAWSRMRTDDRVHVIDDPFLRSVLIFDKLLQTERIIEAIAMRDGEHLVLKRREMRLFEVIEEVTDALLATTSLLDWDQMPFVINMKHRLDGE